MTLYNFVLKEFGSLNLFTCLRTVTFRGNNFMDSYNFLFKEPN